MRCCGVIGTLFVSMCFSFLENPTSLIVRAGEWDTYSITEMIPHQERRVKTIILHENFNTNNLDNDFAILILETAFDIAQNVGTICLPQETDVFDGARCVVTGWGKDKAGYFTKHNSISLRKYGVKLIFLVSLQEKGINSTQFLKKSNFLC